MTDNKSIYPITNGVLAQYKKQMVKEYQGNPLIESLPDVMRKDELIRSMANYPSISLEEQSMSGQIRLHLIERMYSFFQPLPIHIDLEERISRMIRQGYVWRNPFSKEIVAKYYEVYEAIEGNDITYIRDNLSILPTINCLSIIGVSGSGKSVSVGKILNNYPQVIIHSEYKNINFSQYQLVYLFVNAPHDGSIKGLCLDIISKFDQYLGTDYYRKVVNYSAVNKLLPTICKIAAKSSLGLLVIDEIQVISKAKSGGKESILDFFLTLVNTIGVPILLIGTNQAMSMLQSHFRQSRRFTGKGEIIFDRVTGHEQNDWILFARALLRFNATKEPIEAQAEVSKVLYYESQGILDIAVKIFAMAQIEAIKSGSEKVTPELILNVARSKLVMVGPAIEAMKSNDLGKLLEFEDIMPLNYTLNDSVPEINKTKIPRDSDKRRGKEEVIKTRANSRNKIDINELEEQDLRLMVAKGMDHESSAYNILLRNGIIKHLK